MIANHTDEIQQALSAHRALAILQLLEGPLRGGANERKRCLASTLRG